MIQRRFFLAGASTLVLSACGNLLGPPDAGSIFVVRPGFAPAPAGGVKVGWALAIMRPDVPGGLDTDRIALIQPDGTMDYYANATYPDRVTQTVQRALLEGFEASGGIDAVAREQDALHADYNLVTEVRDFQARYSQPDGIPAVAVTVVAKLIASRGRKIVSNFTVAKTGTAAANSAGAVAQALQAALAAAVTDIVNWALAAPPPPSVADGSPNKPEEQALRDASKGAARNRDLPPPR